MSFTLKPACRRQGVIHQYGRAQPGLTHKKEIQHPEGVQHWSSTITHVCKRNRTRIGAGEADWRRILFLLIGLPSDVPTSAIIHHLSFMLHRTRIGANAVAYAPIAIEGFGDGARIKHGFYCGQDENSNWLIFESNRSVMRTKKEKLQRRLARVNRLAKIPFVLYILMIAVGGTIMNVVVDIGFALWDGEVVTRSLIVGGIPKGIITGLFIAFALWVTLWYEKEELESELKYVDED
jgi:hypothetical protein